MITDHRLRELIIDTETQYNRVDRTIGKTILPEHLAEVKTRFADIIEALKELKERRESTSAPNAMINEITRSARLMINEDGHELVCIRPDKWRELVAIIKGEK